MIPFDLVYLRPDSLDEAVEAWSSRPDAALYYGGGTEIVTGCRTGSYRPGAVMDLKRIPELRRLGQGGAGLFFGAALSLNELADSGAFPLLSAAARRIADRSVRNRITLGGNVAGRLPYREALLPFLAADGLAHLAGPGPQGSVELRELPLRELHAKRLQLRPGELVVGLSLTKAAVAAKHYHERLTAGSAVDYPLVTLCALAQGRTASPAISGVYDYPVWAASLDEALDGAGLPRLRSDQRGSPDYRRALLRGALSRAKEALS